MPADSGPFRWNRFYWAVGGYTLVMILLLYLLG